MFSSGDWPWRPKGNLAITDYLPNVFLFCLFLFGRACAFGQRNSLPSFKHLYFTVAAHLLNEVCFSPVFTPLSSLQTAVCTSIPDMLKPQQPASVCVDVEDGFPSSHFARCQPVPSVLCSGGQ